MLTELCQELRNWFDRERYFGEFEISGGVITAPFLVPGQYFRIVGSIFNDGVHCYEDYTDMLTDETFEGAVWALGIPPAVVELSEQISEWRSKYEGVDSAAMSPFNSESFGGYSYSKGNGNTPTGWQAVFSSNLNRWRKI